MSGGPRNPKKKVAVVSAGSRGRAAAGAANLSAWRLLADRLEKDIATGSFRSVDGSADLSADFSAGRLPPEVQLAADLSVSRHTLRAAIAELVRRGVLRSLPYQGTFIAPRRIEFVLGARTRLSEAIENAGFTHGRRILSSQMCSPPGAIATSLGVAKRTQVLEIVQVVTSNDVPLACSTLWMPADRFGRVGEVLASTGSLRRALARAGVNHYRRGLMRITSGLADSNERHVLKLENGSTVVGISGVSVDNAGEPTHAFDYRFDARRIALVVET